MGNEERKSWHSQLYNNWATTLVAILVIVNTLVCWEIDILSVPRDIRELKESAKSVQSLTAAVAEHSRDIIDLKARIAASEANSARKDELLIRMDERLKSIQERLGLKSSESK